MPTDSPAPMDPQTGLPTDWPAPDPDALTLSRTLAERLRARIRDSGPLPFDAWMESVLYEPGLGYYSAGQEKFGAAGDFITAPLVSPLFAWTLAGQCAEALAAVDGDTILELGPGEGSLAADLLAELDRQGRLPERYCLLERSASLRQRQQERIAEVVPHLLERVHWLDALPETPIDGVILGNEVLDALPVVRFQRHGDAIQELAVTTADGGFQWHAQPARTAVLEAVAAIESERGAPLPDGYCSELCLQLPAFMASLADTLGRGLLLLVDYGYPRNEYYRADRHQGTLVCYYRHRAHWDPLAVPGLQDVTAFVDFTAVAEGAHTAGLRILGYNTQAHFLMGAGVTELLEARRGDDPVEQARLAQQAKTLMLPGAMGERFRVLAAATSELSGISGFSLYNQLEQL
ncbi:class I SAM-dependent methyltransferase [Aquisalimonas asiatica]|uniref:SAM-dependent methyltransferase, MidA family n=1 Tax=Aquisalimonas asiatica TaxID=406100 RepID=A0A1H8V6L6_9GAMM|nr:SAM-dependent methyltransferase [Aquisalimonas asiatica]SEP10893.1 SAM-dependent methyltransferase, MidA family [Aquisalimonas asiatica]